MHQLDLFFYIGGFSGTAGSCSPTWMIARWRLYRWVA
jgi:hypothetical protein